MGDEIDLVRPSNFNDNARVIAFYEKGGWTQHEADATSMTFWRSLLPKPIDPRGGLQARRDSSTRATEAPVVGSSPMRVTDRMQPTRGRLTREIVPCEPEG